jgi:hypothetical protein
MLFSSAALFLNSCPCINLGPYPFFPFYSPLIAFVISSHISLATTFGVSLCLVASNTSLRYIWPWPVKAAQSMPFFCNISPYKSPSSLQMSTLELTMRVVGCSLACLAEMLRGDASSDSRSCMLGIYADTALRSRGIENTGPSKNSTSLVVGRSVTTRSRSGCVKVWWAMEMSGCRVEQRVAVATVSWAIGPN